MSEDFLDKLELSVRAHNCLRKSGLVVDIASFMALTEGQVKAIPAAGARTWREVREIQESLRPHTDGEVRREHMERLAALMNTFNAFFETCREYDGDLHLRIDAQGLVGVAKWVM